MNDHPEIPPPPPWPDHAVTGLVEVTDEPIDFTPVPRLRKRRDGWNDLAQRAFIAAQTPPIPRAPLGTAAPRAPTRALSSKLSKLPAPGARHGWGRTKNLFGRGHSRPLTLPLPQGERCDPDCVTRGKPDVTSITSPLAGRVSAGSPHLFALPRDCSAIPHLRSVGRSYATPVSLTSNRGSTPSALNEAPQRSSVGRSNKISGSVRAANQPWRVISSSSWFSPQPA
jgi:hypothetical protein